MMHACKSRHVGSGTNSDTPTETHYPHTPWACSYKLKIKDKIYKKSTTRGVCRACKSMNE